MASVILSAQKGNVKALNTLYDANKESVVALCTTLLGDQAAAQNVTVSAFSRAFDALLAGQIEDEDSFGARLADETAELCKARAQRQNSKAFRLPANLNFANVPFRAESMTVEGDTCEQILANLPTLQKFVYVLYWGARLSYEAIGTALHVNAQTVELIVGAEEALLKNLLTALRERTGDDGWYDTDRFHDDLKKKLQSGKTTKETDDAVIQSFVKSAAPVRKKAAKGNRLTLTIALLSVVLVAGITLGVIMLVGGFGKDDTVPPTSSSKIPQVTWRTSIENPTHYAVIEIENYGKITVALDASVAPATVENFVSIAKAGKYDGTTFHRIIENFMMQGGDENIDGQGGDGIGGINGVENIVGEFTYNGYANDLAHVRGAISMARSTSNDSASSQFFIVHQDSRTSLDGRYAAFGYVIEGIEVVDAICESAQPTDDNGSIASKDQPVIKSIKAYTAEEYKALG